VRGFVATHDHLAQKEVRGSLDDVQGPHKALAPFGKTWRDGLPSAVTLHIHHALKANFLERAAVRPDHQLGEVILTQHPPALGAIRAVLKVPPRAILAEYAITSCLVDRPRKQA